MPDNFNFTAEIHRLIDRSGGYQETPAGPVNMGISLKLLTAYQAQQTTAQQLADLSRHTAHDIYYAYFYIKTDVKSLPTLIKPVMLDMVATMNKAAIERLQEILILDDFMPDPGKLGHLDAVAIAAANRAVDEIGNELIRKLVRRYVIYWENQASAGRITREQLPAAIARAESFLPCAG